MFDTQSLREVEAAPVEKREKLMVMPSNLRSYELDPERHQIHEELRNECTTDAPIAIVRTDADRIQDGSRLDAAKLAKIELEP